MIYVPFLYCSASKKESQVNSEQDEIEIKQTKKTIGDERMHIKRALFITCNGSKSIEVNILPKEQVSSRLRAVPFSLFYMSLQGCFSKDQHHLHNNKEFSHKYTIKTSAADNISSTTAGSQEIPCSTSPMFLNR